MLFVAFAWLGLVIPSTMVLSLEDHGPIAGMASALGGTLQMITGAIMIVDRQRVLQWNSFADGDDHRSRAVAAFILTRLTLRPTRGCVATCGTDLILFARGQRVGDGGADIRHGEGLGDDIVHDGIES